MNRRRCLCLGALSWMACRSEAAVEGNFQRATNLLQAATQSGQVRSAAIYVRHQTTVYSQSMGEIATNQAAFLLGSITKPMVVTALMTLFDQGKFALEDSVQKYLPEFNGAGRGRVTVQHLLTHVSGLPDQLPQNAELRGRHAPLADFVAEALRLPLAFDPGSRYEYSSMGILLAAEIAQRLTDQDIRDLVAERVFRPLRMQNSALGIGRLPPSQIVPAQVEFGAAEAGGGSEASRNWDWNSPYWRQLGAPWGGAHASAQDVATFLDAILKPERKILRRDTAGLMILNHNAKPLESRGLGFDVGLEAYCASCSPETFGHTGSTGTIAWADPQRDLVCVVLTTLPGRAVANEQHPRQLASDAISGG